MSDTSEAVCPECGNDYRSLGQHWRMSSTCEYPDPGPEQEEILAGLLFSGGSFKDSGTGTYTVERTSINREFLEWVREQFPALGCDVTLKVSAEDSKHRAAESFDFDPETTDAEFSDQYKWATRRLATLAPHYERWTDDDGNRVVPLTSHTPLICKVIYALLGWTATIPDSNRDAVHISLTTVDISNDDARTLFSQFAPRIYEKDEGSRQLVLYDSVGFFDYLDADPLTGASPLPGCADKWPDDRESLMDIASTPHVDRCPECGGAFEMVAMHWSRSSTCDFPAVTDHQHAVITGALVVTGHVRRTDTGTSENQYSGLIVEMTDRARLDWLADELGDLAGRVAEKKEPADADRWPDAWDRDGEDSPNRDDIYWFRSRSHPVFNQYRAWYDATADEPPTKTVPESDIERSPTLLRTMYAMRGRLGRTSLGDDRLPALYITTVNASTAFFERLFAPFDPVIVEGSGSTRLVVRDADAFFDYIGPAPTGLETYWQGELNE